MILAGRKQEVSGIETQALETISISDLDCDDWGDLTLLPPVMRTIDLLMML
jgi:hypothetical protein